MRGPNLAPHHLDSRGSIQALHCAIKPFLRPRIWRIEGSNTASHHFGLEGIDSGPSLCNQTFRLRFGRSVGSNASPHYFGLEEIDSSPSLCNYGLKIGSYAPVGHHTKVLKDNERNRGPLTKHGQNNRRVSNAPGLMLEVHQN